MISFQNFSFRYEESKDFTLRGIDMTVRTGEFILLTGRSGCGKTTLIRSLNGLIPHFYPGEIKGDLLMDGHSLLEMKPSELAGQVGTVFQDPRSQFFMTDTTRELAFGCENLGLAREETIDRIARAAKELELVEYLNRSIFALSSGEKQQIAIGSVYALAPKVYIFDEPSANLDYAATKRLAEIMEKLKSAGYTIFVVEHRFYYLRDLIDRAFLIQNGKIEHEFTREQFCSLPEETRISYGLRTAYPERDAEHYQEKPHSQNTTHLLEVHDLGFAYKKGPEVFQNVSFEAHSGDVIGILGHNGAGKTTLLSILTGLLKQRHGEVRLDGKKAHTPAAAVTFLSCYAGYRLSTLCQQRGRRTFPWNAGRLQRKNRCSTERIGTVGLSGKTPSIAFRRSKTTGYHWSGNRKGQPRNLLRRAHQRLGL